jgi:starch phosphorylase
MHRLRLKQQYFWVAASLNDIIRRFQKLQLPWSEVCTLPLAELALIRPQFPQYNAIQLNDSAWRSALLGIQRRRARTAHPTMAIVELMRILVDEEQVDWDEAWTITKGARRSAVGARGL